MKVHLRTKNIGEENSFKLWTRPLGSLQTILCFLRNDSISGSFERLLYGRPINFTSTSNAAVVYLFTGRALESSLVAALQTCVNRLS